MACQVENDSKDEHMQEADNGQNKSNSAFASASIATHTRPIGIIHPPPDIRNIVDKTVSFVAKHGPEFVKKIIDENAANPKINFLNGSDPYHAYYQFRLSEFCDQNQAPGQKLCKSSDAAEKTITSPKFIPVKKVLEPPEAEQYTVRLLEGITGEELDIIKLTSQFVAQNGSFLTGLTSRETNNPHFQFLKPTHSKFKLFKSLTDAYKKVLRPPNGLTDKLKNVVTDMSTVLERCVNRLEWEMHQEQARQQAEGDKEHERRLMSKIDWHDFAVVVTIDFSDDEDSDLPPPMMILDEEENNNNDDDDSINEEIEMRMRIVKNYKRPEERLRLANSNIVVSPITGELIPVNEMSEHMRVSLIDPKYKEQKERMFAKIRETTLAQDEEVSRNIVSLARTRPDIFGTTEEEVSNAVKAEIERKNNQIDRFTDDRNLPGPPPYGLALNLPCVSPNAQYWTVTLPPKQMNYFHQQPYMMNRPPSIPVPPSAGYQLTPLAPCLYMPGMPMVPPPPMPQGMQSPPPSDEARPALPKEPQPKRQRLEDSMLFSEDQFLARHPGPARISVSVPNAEGSLKGQMLDITVESLSESVSSFKEKIAGEIHLPASKQKLSGKAGFLKDNLSLAYYNIGGGETLSLSLKERGGRKR